MKHTGITQITLQNVRCFGVLNLSLTSDCVVIEGPNGSGKSSIVEALYYACYLKSFRTHRASDVPGHGQEHFFIKLQGVLADGDAYTIQVGYEEGDKRVKIDDLPVESYKDLMEYYKVVALSEHDLRIVQEGPEERRSFINQLCLLQDPTLADLLRLNKHLVQQRGELLAQGLAFSDHCRLWSEQLWENSKEIVVRRLKAISLLEEEIQLLTSELALSCGFISLTYKQKGGSHQDFNQFWTQHATHGLLQEAHQKRTLFGAHLDDIIINLDGKNARIYASRGQQKLVVLLLKCAMIRVLLKQDNNKRSLVFILDDFLTDLDEQVMNKVLALICNLGCEVIITCPLADFIKPPVAFQRISLWPEKA